MASASSSHSHGTLGVTGEDSSTFDDSADDDSIHGRTVPVDHKSVNLRFARSLSPTVSRTAEHRDPGLANITASYPTRTPASMRHSSHNHHRIIINLLPKHYIFNSTILHYGAQIDIRKLLEHSLLFSVIILAIIQFTRSPYVVDEFWIVRGIFSPLFTDWQLTAS